MGFAFNFHFAPEALQPLFRKLKAVGCFFMTFDLVLNVIESI